jgi:hypothetical protein
MTAANKRYSYPRVTEIQIDVHHTGGNLTNMAHAFQAQFAYGYRPYVSHVVTDKFGWIPLLPRKMAPNTIHSTPTDRSTGPYPVSLPSFCQWQATRLTRLISLACDRYAQYLLTGVNPLVLNRHTTLRPSQLTVLPFPPKGPTRSQVKQVLPTKPEFEFWRDLWPPRGLLTNRPSTVAYNYA